MPSGEEREVRRLESAMIGGAPISYIIALSAVVAVLALIPLSVVIGSGKSFPMSQSIYGLVGWILGPVAGAVADGMGALVGVLIASHTTTMPLATISGAIVGGFASGAMHLAEGHKGKGAALVVGFTSIYLLYAGRAVLINGADLWAVLLGSFINWSALLLLILPTRHYFVQNIADDDLRKVALGLFGGTWIVAGLSHLSSATIIYLVVNWSNEVWLGMAPFAPLENLVRCAGATFIGTGVIAGLRAVGLVKPIHAAY